MRLLFGAQLTLAVAGIGLVVPACGGKVANLGSTKESPDADTTWYPSAACTPLGAVPKLVLQQRDLTMRIVVPDGDRIWFGARDASKGPGPEHELYSVPLAGGGATAFPAAGFRDGPFTKLGDELVYVQLGKPGTSEADPGVDLVTLLNVKSAVSVTLPNPGQTTHAVSVVAHSSGIYWWSQQYRTDQPSSISRRDPAGNIVELTTLDNYSDIFVDGHELFYVRYFAATPGGRTTELRIEAVPATGGAARVLKSIPFSSSPSGGSRLQLVGVDGEHVYFKKEALDGGGTIGRGDLVVVNKDGSAEHALVVDQRFGGFSMPMDDEWIYWIDGDEQRTIVRVRKAGSAMERIATTDSALRGVVSLAVDRCNVYWVLTNPPAIYGRSH
jgi:hypothetical protein